MAIAFAIFSVLSLMCAVTSDGFLEADACTHYLYARFAFEEPHYLVNLGSQRHQASGRPKISQPAWFHTMSGSAMSGRHFH